MDWKEAKDNTIRMWERLRESIGQDDAVDLLTELNAVADLCKKAHEEAAGRWGECTFCLAYQQIGGCRDVSGEMSDRIAAKDWDEAKRLADEFIARLKQVEPPQ